MSGYIYTMYAGADPGHGWILNDPIFVPTPTLGACVPNIRRAVKQGDYIFAISGRVPGEKQFVVGGFRVAEKINALAAYGRFPEHRLREAVNGQVSGNIITDAKGCQHPLDHHSNFERRVENYIVGGDAVYLTRPAQFEKAREETIPVLADIFGKKGSRVFDLIGRHKSMTDAQVADLLSWFETLQ